MNHQELLAALDRAILGKPNSCLSEHSETLLALRENLLKQAPADPSPSAQGAEDSSPPPQ